MRKKGSLLTLIFLILSMFSYGASESNRVLRQGRNLRSLISDRSKEDIQQYLDGAGIDIDRLMDKPYFMEGDSEGDFFVEIEGNFQDMRLRSSGFIEDEFVIRDKSYRVKYRPNYNEVALVYDEERLYVSNSIEKAYFGIQNIDGLKGELKRYFMEGGSYSEREIAYREDETIYGRSILESTGKTQRQRMDRVYYESFTIDREAKENKVLGRTEVVMDYADLAKVLMKTTPEISLTPIKLRDKLAGEVEGVFATEKGVVFRGRREIDPQEITELYNEGILERIGLTTGREDGIYYLEFPFYDEKKYVFEAGRWTVVSNDLKYIEGLRTQSNEDEGGFMEGMEALMRFKEEDGGYTRYKKGV